MLVTLLCTVFAGAWADTKTDVLNQTWTGITGSSYEEKSKLTGSASDAVYTVQCAGSNSSIQLRSSGSSSGVVTTASGGKVKKITVEWQSNTVNGRTLNVYGKNSAYSAASDLYNSSNQGTLIGTIVCGTSTELTITDDYEYIGFRSASGAMYLTSVSIVWETGGGDTPTEKDDCDLALTGTTDLEFDLYNDADAKVINYTTSSTGTVTVVNSEYINAVVGEGTITVTPLKKTNGEVEITVNQAADDDYKAGSATFTVTIDDSTPKTGAWELTSLADLSEGDVFVIVGNNGSNYAMSNDNGASSAPAAVAVTIENDEITSDVGDNIKWNISGNATDGYTFYPDGDDEKWLYCTNSNNGVRVGTNTDNTFNISDGYLYHSGTSRYVGIYNSSDWRCYTSINNNIKDQTFAFYKYVDGTTPQKADPELSFSSATAEATFGQDFTAPTLNTAEGFNGTVEYSSSVETVAEVMDTETGELRIVGGGTTVITATFAGNDDFKSGSASYTLTVTDNRVATTISQENITIDIADIATLTMLTPVVKDANENPVEYTNSPTAEGLPEVYFEIVSDDNGIFGSFDSHGNVVLNSVVGTATVKAVYNQFQLNSDYRPSECTFTVTVADLNAPGTENNPYSVAEAIAATPSSGTSSNVYIHGIVSAFYGNDIVSDGTNYRYYISDDGTTDSQLLVYKGKGLGNMPFADADDLQIGDEVVVYGGLTLYKGASEIAANNYIVSLDRKLAAPIISGDDKYLGSTDVTINSNVEGATILYSLDNGATWNTYTEPFKISNQTVTVMAKATKDEQESEVASMTFTCMNNQENWVSEAIEALDENPSWEDKWIMGYVWEVGTLSDGSLTYTITDDFGDNKPGDNLILVVNGKGLNGADFTATTDLERGQDITISGNLVKDGDVYKFEDGSQIEDINELSDNPISAYGDIELYASDLETTADVHDYINVDSENIGAFTFVSNDPTIATVDENGIVTPVSAGNTTITVNQAMHWGLYRAGSTTVNVIVNSDTKTDNNFVLSSESETTPYGTPVVLTYMVSEGYTGEIEVVTVNPSAIADVTVEPSNQTITITPKAVGSAVIRIDANQDASFFTANKYVEVTVTAPEGQTDAAITSVTLFNETFDKCDGNGGRDEVFTGSVGTGSTDEKLDESWNSIGNNAASQCIKLGTGKAFSGVTTSSIALTGNGTLTFSAAGWGDSNTNKVNVTAEGASLSGDTEVTLANGEWNSYTVNITEATGDVTITFSMKRGFLDDVLVKSEGESLSVKLNDYGYATYCSQYPLDFNGVTEYTAWLIDEVNDNVITFSQIGRDIKGGQGILLKGTPGATIMLNSVNSDFTLEDNKLIGTTAPTYVKSGEYYGLSGNSFVKVGTTTIPAGKALLPASLIDGSTASRLTFVFEESETTGIHSVENGQSTIENGNWYTLGGQKMNGKPAMKGVYIINGKKVVIK